MKSKGRSFSLYIDILNVVCGNEPWNQVSLVIELWNFLSTPPACLHSGSHRDNLRLYLATQKGWSTPCYYCEIPSQ